MKRIYIAGPMTGLPELNFPAFHAEAARLRAAGHDVINPAEINPALDAKWLDCMKADVPQLMTCLGIHLLPGWENSRGARIEHQLASALGYEVSLAAGATSPSTLADADAQRFTGFCGALLAHMNREELTPAHFEFVKAFGEVMPTTLDELRVAIDQAYRKINSEGATA